VDLGVGLAVSRGEPGPAGQFVGAGEPLDVADLGDEHRAQGRADTGDRLHRDVARILGQSVAGKVREDVDLEVDHLHDPT
jgi:hypothetical protein